MYFSFEEVHALYPDITEAEYNMNGYEAQVRLDDATITVDGVKKLKSAMPIDSDDLEAVRRCFAKLTHELTLVERAKNELISMSSVTSGAEGTHVGSVKSISSGSESISFGTDANYTSPYVTAATNDEKKEEMLKNVLLTGLRGIKDKNGVNLLFGGVYPFGV